MQLLDWRPHSLFVYLCHEHLNPEKLFCSTAFDLLPNPFSGLLLIQLCGCSSSLCFCYGVTRRGKKTVTTWQYQRNSQWCNCLLMHTANKPSLKYLYHFCTFDQQHYTYARNIPNCLYCSSFGAANYILGTYLLSSYL